MRKVVRVIGDIRIEASELSRVLDVLVGVGEGERAVRGVDLPGLRQCRRRERQQSHRAQTSGHSLHHVSPLFFRGLTTIRSNTSSRCRKWCHKAAPTWIDRKSTRLNSSHPSISYAVFCLKKK